MYVAYEYFLIQVSGTEDTQSLVNAFSELHQARYLQSKGDDAGADASIKGTWLIDACISSAIAVQLHQIKIATSSLVSQRPAHDAELHNRNFPVLKSSD